MIARNGSCRLRRTTWLVRIVVAGAIAPPIPLAVAAEGYVRCVDAKKYCEAEKKAADIATLVARAAAGVCTTSEADSDFCEGARKVVAGQRDVVKGLGMACDATTRVCVDSDPHSESTPRRTSRPAVDAPAGNASNVQAKEVIESAARKCIRDNAGSEALQKLCVEKQVTELMQVVSRHCDREYGEQSGRHDPAMWIWCVNEHRDFVDRFAE